MRELKVKAWHKEEKKMCDVKVITFGEGAFLVGVEKGNDFITGDLLVHVPEEGRFCLNDEFELIQFTGRKDKNRKEIYEGGIVKGCCFNGSYAFGKVVQYKTGWIVEPIGNFIEGYDDIDTLDIEVIGNIYENENLIQ